MIALVSALLVMAPPAARMARADVVTVHRGANETAEQIDEAGFPRVERGAAAKTTVYTAMNEKEWKTQKLLAGDRLWIIDPDSGRLTACVLRNSTQIGRKDIRCFTRNMPVSLLRAAD